MTGRRHRRSARRLTVALVAATALAATAAERANAAPTWSPARALSTTQTAFLHNAVAANPRGDTLVVWRDDRTRIQAIFRPAGEEFGTPRQLGDTGSSAPAAAMNSTNDAFVAWCRGGAGALELRVRAAGHLFQQPPASPLGSCTGSATDSQSGGPPAIAAGPNHTLLLAWLDHPGACTQVMAQEVRISGVGYAPLAPAAPISDCPTDAGDPRVAENANGAAAIAFSQGGVVKVASRAAGDGFGEPATVSSASSFNPAVAVANDGTVAAAWDDSSVKQVAATTGPAGQPLPSGAPISAVAHATPGRPAVVFDARNTALIAWIDDVTGTETQLRVASQTPGAGFGAPQPVGAGRNANPADPIALAASPAGGAVVVFARSGVMWAATRALGQPFATARQVSAAGEVAQLPHVAMDAQGDALATFTARVGTVTQNLLRAATYDAAGPALRSLAIPGSGTTGQVLTFAVSPFDVWSAFSTAWDFGDGTRAAGNTVQHAYAAAGTYTVRVAATDAVGNASSAQGAVAIASPPPPPPPPPPDSDGDGFIDAQDCKPFDPHIHPGAIDIPEDGIDQNCDGSDELYPRIDPPSVFWAFNSAKTRFTLIKIQFTGIPKGVRAYARCRGRHCPFKRTKALKSRRSTLNLLKTIKKSKRGMRAGQTLEVVATKNGYMGRVVRVSLRKGRVPKSVRLCLRPGTTKPRACR